MQNLVKRGNAFDSILGDRGIAGGILKDETCSSTTMDPRAILNGSRGGRYRTNGISLSSRIPTLLLYKDTWNDWAQRSVCSKCIFRFLRALGVRVFLQNKVRGSPREMNKLIIIIILPTSNFIKKCGPGPFSQ